MRLLTNDAWREKLSRSIDDACIQYQFDLVAFVFMPDHVHLLVFPGNKEPDVSGFLACIKQPFSSQIKAHLEEAGSPLIRRLMIRERRGKLAFRFWQEGPGCDRNLFQPVSIRASINYIHKNPVERKLCRRAIDWKWSSAFYYLGEPPRQQRSELPYIHGVSTEALEGGSTRH